MKTDSLPLLANIGGATDGTAYGLQITTRNGQQFEVGLSQDDLAKAAEVLIGLASDAGKVVPPSGRIVMKGAPQPVTNLVLQGGRTPEEIILGIQCGTLTLPFSLHPTTLLKLCKAVLAQAQPVQPPPVLG